MSQIYLSAAHKSSGKTTVSIGVCAALTKKGHFVQAFKKGPDYIDPLWLSQATGRSCFNLDFYTTPSDEIVRSYWQHQADADVTLIEGNKGLFDGMDVQGSDSNAALAELLGLPIVLVIDTNGMTRGVAPLILGYQNFGKNLNIAGVILNKVGGARHESKLFSVLEQYTELPIVGSVWKNQALNIDERHLGLIPSNEKRESQAIIDQICDIVEEQVDLDRFLGLANKDQPVPPTGSMDEMAFHASVDRDEVKLGVFKDAAFGFYYPDDLQLFEALGVKIIFIDALKDEKLPLVDGLFIGGGFPETHMQLLSDNQSLMRAVKDYIENNGVVYAECGGLMYLARSLTWGDKHCKMCDVISADVVMNDKPQGRGYIQLAETADMPWPKVESEGEACISAHEFHYSRLENLPENTRFAYEVLRGTGINGQYDGIIYKNLLANYAHLRNVGNNQWVKRFLAKIEQVKQEKIEVG